MDQQEKRLEDFFSDLEKSINRAIKNNKRRVILSDCFFDPIDFDAIKSRLEPLDYICELNQSWSSDEHTITVKWCDTK